MLVKYTDLRDGMTGIRFDQRVSFALLALLARKSGVLVFAFRVEENVGMQRDRR
jgi:hypothetical protein